ncbi:MAG: peptide deformylase [Gammaproteobacteria bacterium]|jgi:peptide deformylase|nr:peptide deformylase [Gammaproteobacteria bacterium]|tara:strand:+ start:1712 stop:2260 length:549 start_codon:yes stop_codon:yes gene_type:complete
MSVKEILKMGNPLLREVAEDFSVEEIKNSETQLLLEDMWHSLAAAGGIGLAAPQIGISKQLAVIKLTEESDRYPDMEDSEAFIIFNPKITVLDKTEQGFWEGCLSVPGLRGFVERPRKIRVDFLDESAKPRSIEVEDFLATVFQHELDHLVGKLYVDRIKDITTLMFEDEMVFEELEEEILD